VAGPIGILGPLVFIGGLGSTFTFHSISKKRQNVFAGLASATPTPVPTPSVLFTKWIALMNGEISSASPLSAELLQWINANPPVGN
jgi:hypothetical protein